MYTTLKRLYNNGKGPLTVDELNRAVLLGWITEQQKKQYNWRMIMRDITLCHPRLQLFSRSVGGRM